MHDVCWVEVDLDANAGNAAHARAVSGARVMAVVKADGYGHGAVPVARAALRGGAVALGVARAGEALALRAAGVRAPVLLFGRASRTDLPALVDQDVALTVWSAEQVSEIAAAAAPGRPGHVQVKVDTGMHRLGIEPGGAPALVAAVAAEPRLVLDGVYTHLACADDICGTVTAAQHDVFERVLADLGRAGLRPPLVHAANSAGTLLGLPGRDGTSTSLAHDLVRFGVALYGLRPGPDVPMAGLRPALTWSTVLTRVHTVPAGEGISYGHAYVTGHDQRIGTLAVGYADGWRRGVPHEVLVRGVRVPVVGRVCMDQCMVDLDAVPGATPGDEVILIGEQGAERITADDVAARWGTIGYEVVCGIGARVPRRYRGAES